MIEKVVNDKQYFSINQKMFVTLITVICSFHIHMTPKQADKAHIPLFQRQLENRSFGC